MQVGALQEAQAAIKEPRITNLSHEDMDHQIPEVVEVTSAADHTFDIYSRLLKERIVLLGTQIDEQVANTVVAQLLFLEADDPEKTINLHLNTTGGDTYAGLAIYDTMQYVRPTFRPRAWALQ